MNAHSKITFSRRPTDRPVAADVRAGLLKDPGFGKVFTDHMVTIRWTQGCGRHDAEVRARAPITLDPAAAVLHYGQEIFEGGRPITSATAPSPCSAQSRTPAASRLRPPA